jgi:transcriptional regulator with GAF, ATPase, and Fis domain
MGSVESLLLDAESSNSAEQPHNWSEVFPEIIGRSAAMKRVLDTVFKVARSDSSVLILGESGTGKELIAAAIHRLSSRADRAYVPLNCSAIPDNLLESDLFGHEKGAFTGADRRRQGKFEYAEGGSIFLDEIGDMAHSLQAKLLRVLQDKKFAPLGGNELKEVNVRIIAATNKHLQQAVKAGEFRLDLYYRLNVLPISIPPLRERCEDIPALLQHFIHLANRTQGVNSPCYLTEELLRFLCQYPWPGNVRQLQNIVERLVVMRGGGALSLADLPREMLDQSSEDYALDRAPQAQSHPISRLKEKMPLPRFHDTQIVLPQQFGALPEAGIDLTQFIEELENTLIKQALERTGNNRNQAAKLLGLNRTTLVERIKKRRITALNDPSKEL